MIDHNSPHSMQILKFGPKRGAPRVCVLDHKRHVRSFLAGMLEERGFIARESGAAELKKILTDFDPHLIVLGPMNGTAEVGLILQSLKFAGYIGRVMLFGGRAAPSLMDMQETGERIGLSMLAPLGTPFRDSALVQNVSCFLPISPPPDVAIDLDEAMQSGWLEVWYEPKIDPRSLKTLGVEAMLRVRHPSWGLLSPAHFAASATDPNFRQLSQFIVMRTMADCRSIAEQAGTLSISANLPVVALYDMEFVDKVLAAIPDHACKRNFQVEIRCAEVAAEQPNLQHIASQLAFRNIGISIDEIGIDSASFVRRRDVPVVEMKVGREYVRGCADDRLKQAVCSEIVAIARESGARSVAEGVDTQPDYIATRELGFDLVQGKLFGAPMELKKLVRSITGSRSAARNAQ